MYEGISNQVHSIFGKVCEPSFREHFGSKMAQIVHCRSRNNSIRSLLLLYLQRFVPIFLMRVEESFCYSLLSLWQKLLSNGYWCWCQREGSSFRPYPFPIFSKEAGIYQVYLSRIQLLGKKIENLSTNIDVMKFWPGAHFVSVEADLAENVILARAVEKNSLCSAQMTRVSRNLLESLDQSLFTIFFFHSFPIVYKNHFHNSIA